MKNPCGSYMGATGNPLSKKTNGKLSGVFGKRGTVRKFITGR